MKKLISMVLACVMAFTTMSAITLSAEESNVQTYVEQIGDCTYKVSSNDSTGLFIIDTYENGKLVSTHKAITNSHGLVEKTTYSYDELGNITKTIESLNPNDYIKVTEKSVDSLNMLRASSVNLGGFYAEYGVTPKTQVNMQCSYTSSNPIQTTYDVTESQTSIASLLALLIKKGITKLLKPTDLGKILISVGFKVVGDEIIGGYEGRIASLRYDYITTCTDIYNNSYTRTFTSSRYVINEYGSSYEGAAYNEGLVPSVYWRTTKFADEIMFRMYDISTYSLKSWY